MANADFLLLMSFTWSFVNKTIKPTLLITTNYWPAAYISSAPDIDSRYILDIPVDVLCRAGKCPSRCTQGLHAPIGTLFFSEFPRLVDFSLSLSESRRDLPIIESSAFAVKGFRPYWSGPNRQWRESSSVL
ncbi:hypothetical protein CY34DRAFT_331260 [Suillus luteus UH-Slu-Lm8-n1]|uniref:Uncharacterized protein n=1 Tax=Suillus luteus UH-Slu-Lm8-n1 TaxID=930992 RepID=A0A0D0AZ36_9AGAM|nr:hypothetical protein CY34DRAFT_331260 [Suillus luteus UH-Slu-Lm8-n1]